MRFVFPIKGLLLACALAGLSACTTPERNFPQAPSKLVMSDAPARLQPYLLQIGDMLDIKFLLNPELNEEVTVRPDGMISTSLLQDIPAFGRTPAILQNELNAMYRQELTDPKVSVSVKDFAPTRFYVLGEVAKPGEYEYVGPKLTLLQALAMAGDVEHSAEIKEIVITRQMNDGTSVNYLADYQLAAHGLDPQANVPLAPYDVLFVPRTSVAEAFVHYEQNVQQFLRPSVGLGLSYRLDDNGD